MGARLCSPACRGEPQLKRISAGSCHSPAGLPRKALDCRGAGVCFWPPLSQERWRRDAVQDGDRQRRPLQSTALCITVWSRQVEVAKRLPHLSCSLLASAQNQPSGLCVRSPNLCLHPACTMRILAQGRARDLHSGPRLSNQG